LYTWNNFCILEILKLFIFICILFIKEINYLWKNIYFYIFILYLISDIWYLFSYLYFIFDIWSREKNLNDKKRHEWKKFKKRYSRYTLLCMCVFTHIMILIFHGIFINPMCVNTQSTHARARAHTHTHTHTHTHIHTHTRARAFCKIYIYFVCQFYV